MNKKRNYKIYLVSNVITSLAGGIFGPFYILFVQQKGGGLEKFAIAMGLLLLVQSIVSYYAGKFSDIFGRKPLLIFEGYVYAIVILLYLFIDKTWQLYSLQMIMGFLAGLELTASTAFLGDITEKEKRGADIGRYHAIVGIVTALAMMAGGYIIAIIGIKSVFVLMAVASTISASIFWFIKE